MLTVVVIGAALAQSSLAMAKPEVPRYDRGRCVFEGAAELDGQVECGTLVVPENHTQPDKRVVQVAVAVVKAQGEKVRADPLVYLSGGPGERGIGTVSDWLAHPVAQHRDIILVDQRGTGRSEPLCPDLAKRLLEIVAEDLSPEQDVARNRDAAADCLKSMRDRGVEPHAYGSASTAADLETLRRLLGYESWNLLGVSYGTRVALTATRDFPKGIRSVILDSPFSPQDDFFRSMRASFAPARDRLAADCDGDPRCRQAGSDLRAELSAMLAELDQKPLALSIDAPELFPAGTFVLNRQDLQMLLSFQIRDAGVRAVLPAFLRAWRQGNTESLAVLIKIFAHMWSTVDVGKYYAVQCFEEMPFSAVRAGAESAAAPLDPEYPPNAFLDAAATVCADWGLAPADSLENEAVRSAVPVLLLAGELDYTTSPTRARQTASHLSNSTVIEVPGAGHSVGSHGCVPQVVATFVDAPERSPDSSCLDGHTSPPPLGALRLSSGPLQLLRGLQGSAPLDSLWLAVSSLVLALAALLWPLGGLLRWRRRRRASATPRSKPGSAEECVVPAKAISKRLQKAIARGSLGLAAVAAWVFMIGLADAIASLLGGRYGIAILAGLPSDSGGLFLLPKATAVLLCAAMTATVLSWRSTSWSRFERFHHASTLVGGIAWLAFVGSHGLL